MRARWPRERRVGSRIRIRCEAAATALVTTDGERSPQDGWHGGAWGHGYNGPIGKEPRPRIHAALHGQMATRSGVGFSRPDDSRARMPPGGPVVDRRQRLTRRPHLAPVAQGIEQRPSNPLVAGSNPAGGT